MTTAGIIDQLKMLMDNQVRNLEISRNSEYHNDVKALTAAIETISRTASSEKLYTAFDVIRLVQRAVSDEVCAMDANEAAIGYEIERSIIGELVKEDEHETNETGFGG